jgi:hypothetical protein
VDDESCLFCSEKGVDISFECCVAKIMWQWVQELTDKQLGWDFESVAKFWVVDKKHKSLNILTSAILWSIWKYCVSTMCSGQVCRCWPNDVQECCEAGDVCKRKKRQQIWKDGRWSWKI